MVDLEGNIDGDIEAEAPRGTGPLVVGLLLLAGFLAIEALAMKSYTRHESRPPAWDQSVHLEIAQDYREAWKDRDVSKIWKLGPKPGMPPFPPLYHLGMMLLMDPADPVPTSIRINWLYLALLCLSIFAISYEFKPDSSALAGAVIMACSPIVQKLLYTQLVDLSVAAMVGMSYWALFRSQRFTRWGGSIAFGVLFAAGMMHKWSYFTYMVPAYIMGLGALVERKARLKVVVAAALALAGCLPWYATHLSILVPRLLEASTDYGVASIGGLGLLQYLIESATWLGLGFWAFGWTSVAIPDAWRHKKEWWAVVLWLIAAYVIWTLVPNRQMRFILPGLIPLAICLGVASWPKTVLWVLGMAQALVALNFATGMIAPINLPIPFFPITLNPVDPPRAEDWKIKDILRAADEKRDRAQPVSNVTLVANDTYFNGPNFTWMAKREGLTGINMRGVTSRFVECSEFVVLKKGYLGPEKVIQQLPKAAQAIDDPDGWFKRSYEKVGGWPLPDGSEAVLFKQKKAAEPFAGRNVAFQNAAVKGAVIHNLKIQLGPWDPARGVYRTAEFSADDGIIRDLPLAKVDFVLEDVGIVPFLSGIPLVQFKFDEVRFLKLRRLRVKSAVVSREALMALIRKRMPALRIDRLDLEKNILLEGVVNGLAIRAELAVALKDAPRRVEVDVVKAQAGVLSLPASALGRLSKTTISLEPNPETPFSIDLPGLTIKDGAVTIP